MLRTIEEEEEQEKGDVKKLLNSADGEQAAAASTSNEFNGDFKPAAVATTSLEKAGGEQTSQSKDPWTTSDQHAPVTLGSGSAELLVGAHVAPQSGELDSHTLELLKDSSDHKHSLTALPLTSNVSERNNSPSPSSQSNNQASVGRLVTDEDTASGLPTCPLEFLSSITNS